MSLELKGKIKAILETKSGVGKQSGKEWKSLTFVIANNEGYEGREEIYAFDINGFEKEDGKGFETLENFLKFNKVGDEVNVSYNIRTNEYQGRYYTSLSAWMIKKEEGQEQPKEKAFDQVGVDDDLPF